MKLHIVIGLLVIGLLFTACAKQGTDTPSDTPTPADTIAPTDTAQNEDTVNSGALLQESQTIEETTEDLDDTEVDTQVTSTENTLEDW